MGEQRQDTDAVQDNDKRQWHENAVLYELDVENFQDSNGDGIGDFRGLISRLNYIRDLGVQCIWLQPFYATPNRDDGYDVSDYLRIDPRLGTMEDFDTFIREAHARGLKVIADLTLNHVSTEHPWFQDACADRNSPYRDYFIWSDKLPEKHDPYPIFGPEQGGNWEWNEQARQYYFHTFYRFMPDLNLDNPRVCEELLEVARFWMSRGLHGFRLDAVPFLHHLTEDGEEMREPHHFLKDLHRVVNKVNPDAMLLAEANLKPKQMRPYFGDGDEMDLLLNFYLCNHIFLSVATEKAEPIVRSWGELPQIPKQCNWANFLRNHDELSLDQLTDAEREQVFKAFAPQENMRLYGRGIRRRLAPMFDGDQRRIELIYSLLFTLPGTPVINCGEEIGLGDNLRLTDRHAARTPMQWDESQNAGFSTAARDRLVRPVVDEGPFGYRYLNVARQLKDEESLLWFFRRAVKAYLETPAFGRGGWTFLDAGDPAVLAHRCECEGNTVYALHNLSAQPKSLNLELPNHLTALLSDANYDLPESGQIRLNGYGYRWLKQESDS